MSVLRLHNCASRAVIGFVAALLVAPILSAADAPTETAKTAQKASTASPSAKWEKEIQGFELADKKQMPPEGAVLFTGASGIRMWKSLATDFPDQKVINRGFGGSEMADAVYFAERIVIPYKPRLIVIQAGGNDINSGKSPEQVFADFKAFVAKVRAKLPDVRIAYLSMNPSPSRWSQREKQQRGNQLMKEYIASEKNLDYIDFWDVMLGPDGQPREDLFIQDRLHNNAAGYKIRADMVRPHLK
jgi:lysophospholipase L1-like esterase